MASIRERERADGTYTYAVLYTIDGRQTSVPWHTRAEAEDFCALIKAVGARRAMEIENIPLPATSRARSVSGLTVEQWLTRYIDHRTGVEQKTIDDYRRYARKDIGPILGAIPLAKLTEEDIAAWVNHLKVAKSEKTGRPLSPKTIKHLHGFLSGALATAVPRYIPANPAAGRRLPRGKSDDVDVVDRLLSHDEFARLLAAVTEPWKPMVEFLVASGCRWGEAAALHPEDVDRDAGTVRIRRAWKYSSAGYEIGLPKTRRSKRTIGIPRDLLDKLDYSHEWLFVNRAGGPVRYSGFRSRVWDPAVKRAGLDPPPTPHALRHTCASWLLLDGWSMLAVSRHLGHESALMTADVYGGIDQTVSTGLAEAMGRLLARPPQKAIEA